MWHSFLREMNVKAGCEVYRNAVKEPKVADDLVPYCFRHSFATDLKDANIPFRIRQELLGHADSSVTDRYTHRTEESLNTARELLEIYRKKQDVKVRAIQRDILDGKYESKEIPETISRINFSRTCKIATESCHQCCHLCREIGGDFWTISPVFYHRVYEPLSSGLFFIYAMA